MRYSNIFCTLGTELQVDAARSYGNKILYNNLTFFDKIFVAVEDFVTLFMGKKSRWLGNVLFGHAFDKLVYALLWHVFVCDFLCR